VPPTIPIEKRFWGKVNKDGPIPTYRPGLGPCWIWTAGLTPKGYGWLSEPGRRGYSVMAHRLSWKLLRGEIPTDMQLDHLCRVRSCVNPGHLEVVTSRINTLRGDTIPARFAARTECSHGHSYTPENTHINRIGARVCRTCDRERTRMRPERVAKRLVRGG
jgi:HNH endonuclease